MKKMAPTITTGPTLTFTIPHILLSASEKNGRSVLAVREGGFVQIQHTTTTDFYDEPVDEGDELFVIKAKNQINFGGLRLEVLNDAIEGLPPSSPSASDYMKQVGKIVMLSSICTRSNAHSREAKQDVYQVIRTKIKLP